MLNPKPRAELSYEAEETTGEHGGASVEPRSFFPMVDARGRAYEPSADSVLGSARAPWPQAWASLEPQALIHVPTEAANAPAPLTEEQLRKRALVVIPCLNEEPLIAGVIARILEDDGLVDPLVLVADG